MGTVLASLFIGFFVLLAVGGAALQVWGLFGRMKRPGGDQGAREAGGPDQW